MSRNYFVLTYIIPYFWAELGHRFRTLRVAHDWIISHWAELSDGDVVDVQYILLETTAPKIPERIARRASL